MTALEEYERFRFEQPPSVLALADAAIESLKCCGNCKHADMDPDYLVVCGNPDLPSRARRAAFSDGQYLGMGDSCIWQKSRWQERT